MKVNVHAVNFNIDRKLVDFIDERMTKLEKYYDKVISSDAFLKVENISEKENKTIELKVLVPGDDFIVKKHLENRGEHIPYDKNWKGAEVSDAALSFMKKYSNNELLNRTNGQDV